MKKQLKVVLINHSDSLGGASVVTYRLMNALRSEGVDARMVVFRRAKDDENVSELCCRKDRVRLFLKEQFDIFFNNGLNRRDMFKVSVAREGFNIIEHPWVAQADVVCLNWVNQGMVSYDAIDNLVNAGKHIVWTMHDMWNLTGICHHAHECEAYREKCGNCQYVKKGRVENDLSRQVWELKKALYDRANIHFVAVSNWLADKCRESSLLKNKKLSIIPNAFPTDFYGITPSFDVDKYNIDFKKNVIVMGAARLDDPIKGIDYAIEAFNYIFDNYPEVANNCLVVMFGDIRKSSMLQRIRLPYRYLGRLSDPKSIKQIYAGAKIVLSTSLYETLPGTLIEGEAAGCVPVTFGMGGQADIIDHKVNGYIADYKSAKSIAEGIVWALENAPSRESQHEDVRRRFDSKIVAKRYIEVFNSMIEKKH